MRLTKFAAVFAALAAPALLAAPPAAAQTQIIIQPRPAVKPAVKPAPRRLAAGQPTIFVNKDETGRRRTRIIVQRRSYLDGGTEVLPGERKYSDYAIPPNYSVTGVIDNTTFSQRSPLLGMFDLNSKNSPFGW